MQRPWLPLLFLTLGGCAASGPVLNGQPIDIEADQLQDYWVPLQAGVFVRAPKVAAPCGVVDFSMLVDSEGVVHDFTVIDSEPGGAFDRAARQQAEARRYEPSSTNTQRTPVRYRNHVTFDTDNDDGIDCGDVVKEKLEVQAD